MEGAAPDLEEEPSGSNLSLQAALRPFVKRALALCEGA